MSIHVVLAKEAVNGRNKRCSSVLCQRSARCPSVSNQTPGVQWSRFDVHIVTHTNIQVTGK